MQKISYLLKSSFKKTIQFFFKLIYGAINSDQNQISKKNILVKQNKQINHKKIKTTQENSSDKIDNIINNIQTEKKALLKLQNNIGKQSKIQESIKNMKSNTIKRKKSLTPTAKTIRGLVSHNSWYNNTFKEELQVLNTDSNQPPPAPTVTG